MLRDTSSARRRLTYFGLGLLVAYLVGVQVLGFFRDRGWVTAGTLQALEREEAFYLPEERVFVVSNGGRPVALSALSPHLGERLVYCRSSGQFRSPGHGETFDRLGFYVLGPAPSGMDRVEIRVVGDLVQVKPESVTEGPARDAREPQKPAGPLCAIDAGESPPGFFEE